MIVAMPMSTIMVYATPLPPTARMNLLLASP
jgi:hypothetical protein